MHMAFSYLYINLFLSLVYPIFCTYSLLTFSASPYETLAHPCPVLHCFSLPHFSALLTGPLLAAYPSILSLHIFSPPFFTLYHYTLYLPHCCLLHPIFPLFYIFPLLSLISPHPLCVSLVLTVCLSNVNVFPQWRNNIFARS